MQRNFLISTIILIFIVLSCSVKSFHDPQESIATIVSFETAYKGGDAKFYYFANGKKYYTKRSNTAYRQLDVIGESYKMLYERENPSDCQILTYFPIFLEGENILKKEGVVDRFFTRGRNSETKFYGIEFSYYVNGEKYKKSQNLQLDFLDKYAKPKKGDMFIVRYWVDNPQRSVIYFNEPIKGGEK